MIELNNIDTGSLSVIVIILVVIYRTCFLQITGQKAIFRWRGCSQFLMAQLLEIQYEISVPLYLLDAMTIQKFQFYRRLFVYDLYTFLENLCGGREDLEEMHFKTNPLYLQCRDSFLFCAVVKWTICAFVIQEILIVLLFLHFSCKYFSKKSHV